MFLVDRKRRRRELITGLVTGILIGGILFPATMAMLPTNPVASREHIVEVMRLRPPQPAPPPSPLERRPERPQPSAPPSPEPSQSPPSKPEVDLNALLSDVVVESPSAPALNEPPRPISAPNREISVSDAFDVLNSAPQQSDVSITVESRQATVSQTGVVINPGNIQITPSTSNNKPAISDLNVSVTRNENPDVDIQKEKARSHQLIAEAILSLPSARLPQTVLTHIGTQGNEVIKRKVIDGKTAYILTDPELKIIRIILIDGNQAEVFIGTSRELTRYRIGRIVGSPTNIAGIETRERPPQQQKSRYLNLLNKIVE